MNEEISDEEVKRTYNDLEMMRRPCLWPVRGILFLKRRKERGLDTATLVTMPGLLGENAQKGYAFVAEGAPAEQWLKGGDELLRRLVSEGWIVD
jgi:hypothetical protein